jgi:hypothetical protein
VDNDPNQGRSASLVLYRDGFRRPAQTVGRLLNISEVRSIDADTRALAGPKADVVVILGADQPVS